MGTRKKAAKLKPAQKLAEAEWVQELRHIENEVTHVVDIFNFLDEITRLGNESKVAFDVFNATPLFWNVHRDCLQESMFMGGWPVLSPFLRRMGSLICFFHSSAFQQMLRFSVPPRLRGEDSGFTALWDEMHGKLHVLLGFGI